jgi:hypothetical protein
MLYLEIGGQDLAKSVASDDCIELMLAMACDERHRPNALVLVPNISAEKRDIFAVIHEFEPVCISFHSAEARGHEPALR